MRINELLVESQQLDEGPFTQAIGKVGGKIAKGIANVGKDLKTGFKAGYSDKKPAPKTAAPVKKTGGIKAAIDQFKQGFSQGRGEPAVATPTAAATTPTAVDPAAEKQSKIGVRQINKIIPTLRTRDLLSLQANLEKAIASKKKTTTTPQPTPVEPKINQPIKIKSAKQTAPQTQQQQIKAGKENLGPMVAEGFSIFRKH